MDIRKNNTKFIIFEIIVIMLCIIGVTFAVSYVMKSINVNVDTAALAVDYTGNLTLPTVNLTPIEDSSVSSNTENVMRINFTVKGVSSNPDIPIIYDVILSDLQMDEELKNEYLKWELEKNGEVISSGNFSPWFDSMKDGKLWLTEIQQDLPTSSENADSYEFRIWISESCPSGTTCTEDMDQSNMLNKSISGKIETVLYTKGKEALVRNHKIPASEYIESLLSSNPETMNNDDSDSNIRYMGADPNNYVSFNNELWRIIGVFDVSSTEGGLTEKSLKIVKKESLGNMKWDGNGKNDWSTSSLKNYLNTEYYNSLSLDSKMLIKDVYWNLGGTRSNSELYANDYYSFERGTITYNWRPTYWIGKIGLIYPSDYMYAGDLTKCKLSGFYWGSDPANCRDMSWLKNVDLYQWTLSPSADYFNNVFVIFPNGSIDKNRNVTHNFAVFPTLFLKHKIEIVDGSGTSTDPYILSND